jgi:hypothetical protein
MNEQVLTKMFERMLNLKKEHNKEVYDEVMNSIYFSCHKKDHTIHDCFLVFLHKKRNFQRIQTMLATSNLNSNEMKKEERNPLNLILITKIENSSIVVDVFFEGEVNNQIYFFIKKLQIYIDENQKENKRRIYKVDL